MAKREVTNVWKVYLLASILVLLSAGAEIAWAVLFNSGLVAPELWVAVGEVNWLLSSEVTSEFSLVTTSASDH